MSGSWKQTFFGFLVGSMNRRRRAVKVCDIKGPRQQTPKGMGAERWQGLAPRCVFGAAAGGGKSK